MAPEVLAKKPFCGVKADMFSLGVLLFIMAFGSPPFH
jgi:serine/threonine protein kinase